MSARTAGHRRAPDGAVGASVADMVLVTEHRNGGLDLRLRPVLPVLARPGPLQGPAGIMILLPQSDGLPGPSLGNAPFLQGGLFLIGSAPARSSDTVRPDMAGYLLPFSQASNSANRSSIASARVRCSRNSRIIMASGTGSSRPSRKKPMNDSKLVKQKITSLTGRALLQARAYFTSVSTTTRSLGRHIPQEVFYALLLRDHRYPAGVHVDVQLRLKRESPQIHPDPQTMIDKIA